MCGKIWNVLLIIKLTKDGKHELSQHQNQRNVGLKPVVIVICVVGLGAIDLIAPIVVTLGVEQNRNQLIRHIIKSRLVEEY